jgi:hypothetical protein
MPSLLQRSRAMPARGGKHRSRGRAMTDDPIELDGVAALKWTALLIGLAFAIAALTKQ